MVEFTTVGVGLSLFSAVVTITYFSSGQALVVQCQHRGAGRVRFGVRLPNMALQRKKPPCFNSSLVRNFNILYFVAVTA